VRSHIRNLLYALSYLLVAQEARCYVPAVKLLPLKCTPNRNELLNTVYRRYGYAETRLDFAHTLSTSAGNRIFQNLLTDDKEHD